MGFQNYKIKTIWEQADGTQLVFAEQHYIKVYWDKLEGRQELHQINDILVAKLAENDTILWARIIPKRQKGEEMDIQMFLTNFILLAHSKEGGHTHLVQ